VFLNYDLLTKQLKLNPEHEYKNLHLLLKILQFQQIQQIQQRQMEVLIFMFRVQLQLFG
jgi:hypothetical protein